MVRPPFDGEAIHQGVDSIECVVLGLVGEVGVAGGGENAVMTEDLLDLDQIDTGLDQVGGVAVPKAVGRDLFFSPQAPATRRKVICTPPRSRGEVALAAPFTPP